MDVNIPTVDLVELWRVEVEEAARQYSQDHSIENRDELRKVLRVFTDLIVRNQVPPLHEPVRR